METKNNGRQKSKVGIGFERGTKGFLVNATSYSVSLFWFENISTFFGKLLEVFTNKSIWWQREEGLVVVIRYWY